MFGETHIWLQLNEKSALGWNKLGFVAIILLRIIKLSRFKGLQTLNVSLFVFFTATLTLNLNQRRKEMNAGEVSVGN